MTARGSALRVAVIGAGMAGLSAARTLGDHGHSVELFEKSRGVGGRLATRRADGTSFDHGAQYVTVRDQRFRKYLDSWRKHGVVEPWAGRIAVLGNGRSDPVSPGIERFIACPGMNTLARHLLDRLAVRLNTTIAKLDRDADTWVITDEEDCSYGDFDALVISTPPAQVLPLLGDRSPLYQRIAGVHLGPCWALMASLNRPIDVGFDGAFVNGGPLRWICRNNSKPGRTGPDTWVLHAAPQWSEAHLQDSPESVEKSLWNSFRTLVNLPREEPRFKSAHRWRYALADQPLNVGSLWDADKRLAVCGDWCHGSRVEGAFLSGLAAAARITARSLAPDL